MPGLVGKSQSAFVKGRKIHYGALVACEMVQWLKLKKKASAVIKLDFQKAYDRIKWCFVDTILEKMGFRRTWRVWVRECVTSASVSILINGSPSKPFKMERGLRQGDPLSPCLFVLVVDVLNRMIEEAVRNRRISPLLVGRDKIVLSYLQFADDTILFCPPEEETVRNYKRLLRCFEMMSGLSINFEKSNLIPVNCSQEWILPKRGGPWRDICQVQIKEQHVRQKLIDGLAMEVGDGRTTRFWEDKWIQVGKLKDNFPRLFLISNKKGSVIGDCGFWDGIEWVWRFQWRRELRQWETDVLDQLLLVLQSVRLIADVQDRMEETMDEEILSYRFTKDIWKGLVPPRVELFFWYGVLGYRHLDKSGLCPVL
nr:uncharacterized protein LOC112709059 [Arachis hypogaea]